MASTTDRDVPQEYVLHTPSDMTITCDNHTLYRVSSRAVREACKTLDVCTENKGNGTIYIPSFDDNIALTCLLEMIHRLPLSLLDMTPQFLYRVAVAADCLNCASTVDICAARWIQSLRLTDCGREDLWRLLWVADILQLEHELHLVSRDLVLQQDTPFDEADLPDDAPEDMDLLPGGILEKLETKRQTLIRDFEKILLSFVEILGLCKCDATETFLTRHIMALVKADIFPGTSNIKAASYAQILRKVSQSPCLSYKPSEGCSCGMASCRPDTYEQPRYHKRLLEGLVREVEYGLCLKCTEELLWGEHHKSCKVASG